MAFTFVATTRNYNSSFSTNLSINKPTWTANWDIMFLHILSLYSLSSPTPTVSWWTKLWQGRSTYELWYKIANNEWASYTIEWNQNIKWTAVIATFRWWFNTEDAIDVFSNTIYDTSNTTLRAASMTVWVTNSPLLFFGWLYSTSSKTFTKPTSPTTDWVEHYDWWDTDSDIWSEICSMTWTSSGSTGNIDATISASVDNKHAFAVALNPESTWNPWAFFQMF